MELTKEEIIKTILALRLLIDEGIILNKEASNFEVIIYKLKLQLKQINENL